jgi:hypothetical protein
MEKTSPEHASVASTRGFGCLKIVLPAHAQPSETAKNAGSGRQKYGTGKGQQPAARGGMSLTSSPSPAAWDLGHRFVTGIDAGDNRQALATTLLRLAG